MFLKLTPGGELLFEDRENFRAFKLVVEGGRERLDAARKATAGKAELPDAETSWISEDALRQWPGVVHDAAYSRTSPP